MAPDAEGVEVPGFPEFWRLSPVDAWSLLLGLAGTLLALIALTFTLWTFVRVGNIQRSKREVMRRAKSRRTTEVFEEVTAELTRCRQLLRRPVNRRTSRDRRTEMANALSDLSDSLGRAALALHAQRRPNAGSASGSVLARLIKQLEDQSGEDPITAVAAKFSSARQLAEEASRLVDTGASDIEINGRVLALRTSLDNLRQTTLDLAHESRNHEFEEIAL